MVAMMQPIPTLDSKLQNTVRGLRRRLWMERGVFLALLAGAAAVYLQPVLFPRVWAAYVDGRPVVAFRSRESLQAALEQVKRSEAEGAADAQFVQNVRMVQTDPKSVPVVEPQAAIERLASTLELRATRAVIYIDDTAAVALPEREDAHAVLQQIKAAFTRGLDKLEGAPAFKEKVEIREETADQEAWADRETALALLKGEDGDRESRHTVASGETASFIARERQLSLEELGRLNPGVNLHRLHPGQEIALGELPDPLLTVVARGETTQTLATPFPTETRTSPKMFADKRLVKQPGRPGRQRVTYRLSYENGKLVQRELASREVLVAPRPEIVVVGGKARP